MPTRPPPKSHRPPELLTPAEVSALIGACSLRAPTGIRNRALITLLYRSGLRISEALGNDTTLPLRVADIDFNARSIRVLHGKGDQATTRYYHPSADDALVRWVETRKALMGKAGLPANGGTPLFCTLSGDRLSSGYVRDMLKRQAKRAGIAKAVRPHGLRHTFAAELEAAGVPVSVISKLLGHSSIAVTSVYLDHLTNAGAGKALAETVLPPLGLGVDPVFGITPGFG